MRIDEGITARSLQAKVERTFELAAAKSRALHARWDAAGGSPVYTVEGRYTTRGWTDWTLGFFTGIPILLFDATGDARAAGPGPRQDDPLHGAARFPRGRARPRL